MLIKLTQNLLSRYDGWKRPPLQIEGGGLNLKSTLAAQ